jgi:hypothetical protein
MKLFYTIVGELLLSVLLLGILFYTILRELLLSVLLLGMLYLLVVTLFSLEGGLKCSMS